MLRVPAPRSAFRMGAAVLSMAIVLSTGLAMPSGVSAATTTSTTSTTDVPCNQALHNWKTRLVECRLPPAASDIRYRLSVVFTGSHDDTSLSLAASLDGRELACEPGSKTRSDFEDGTVVLSCGFALTAPGTTETLLEATVKFNHADYESFALEAQ